MVALTRNQWLRLSYKAPTQENEAERFEVSGPTEMITPLAVALEHAGVEYELWREKVEPVRLHKSADGSWGVSVLR